MYRLSPHTFLCVGRRYCVLLDARNDRYFSVPTDAMDSLGRLLDGWQSVSAFATSPDRTFVEDLCRREILIAAPHEGKPVRPQIIIAAMAGTRARVCSIGASQLLKHGFQLIVSIARTRRQFKTPAFQRIIEQVLRTRTRTVCVATERHREACLVSVFQHCRPYYSRRLACLFDSMCLLNFLALYGFYPSLVFGVIPEPFQAHCWLQEGTLVLNDTLERVQPYTPIMCI